MRCTKRGSTRVKALAFSCSEAIPLATATSIEQDYELSIHFRPAGAQDQGEEIDGAYVTYLRFANFGKEPIRAADIPPANPLVVRVGGERVLDISLSASRRSVSQIRVEPLKVEADAVTAAITFDFLDFHDGGVVRVLSAGEKVDIALVGDIIGMPSGILQADGDDTVAVKGWGMALFGCH